MVWVVARFLRRSGVGMASIGRFHRFAVKSQTRRGRRCPAEWGRESWGRFAAVPEEGWADSGGKAAGELPTLWAGGGPGNPDRRCSPGSLCRDHGFPDCQRARWD